MPTRLICTTAWLSPFFDSHSMVQSRICSGKSSSRSTITPFSSDRVLRVSLSALMSSGSSTRTLRFRDRLSSMMEPTELTGGAAASSGLIPSFVQNQRVNTSAMTTTA